VVAIMDSLTPVLVVHKTPWNDFEEIAFSHRIDGKTWKGDSPMDLCKLEQEAV
jgi:hypothetical protein